MINTETLKKQIEDFQSEMKVTVENRDRLIQMLNQQEAKIQQLMGAIAGLEKVLKDNVEEAKDGGVESKDGV